MYINLLFGTGYVKNHNKRANDVWRKTKKRCEMGVEDFLHINRIMANTLQCFKSFRDRKDIKMQF